MEAHSLFSLQKRFVQTLDHSLKRLGDLPAKDLGTKPLKQKKCRPEDKCNCTRFSSFLKELVHSLEMGASELEKRCLL